MKFTITTLFCAGISFFVTTASGATLSVNGAQTLQTVDGYGVNMNLGWNASEVKPAIDLLVDQLGASKFRAVIEESDWESTNDDSDPNHFNWTYYNSVFTNAKFQGVWSLLSYLNQKGITEDGLIISMMGKPADWMGPNQTVTAANEDEFVETISAVLYYARFTAGIRFRMISPINEADLPGTEGPSMSPTQVVRVLHKLSDKLDSLGMSDVRFIAPEFANTSQSDLDGVSNDPVVFAKLAHFGVHAYGGSWSSYAQLVANTSHPNAGFWVTETASFSLALGELGANPASVMVWDGFDSVYQHAIRDGRGSTPPNDSPGIEAPLVAYNSQTHAFSPRKQFYEWSQLIKFVRPNAARLSSTDNNANLVQYAFKNADGHLVIVGRNTGSSALPLDVTLSGVSTSSSLQVYQTNSSLNLARAADVNVVGGGFSISIPANTYFTLVDAGATGPVPPTVNLSANPTSVTTGGSSTLTWSSTNATSCSASGAWSGALAVSGSQVLSNLSTTSTYTLTCTGAGGSASQSVTIMVTAAQPPPTVTITASPTSVVTGGSSTLTWSSTNATSCVASGAWTGNKALSGSEVRANLMVSGTYTLTCTGNGSAVSSATIDVTPSSGTYSIFTTQTPALPNVTDNVAYELGMKFRSTQAGTITAIRYYRAASESSAIVHTGRIWSASGTLLGSVVFSGESASGWQQAQFSSPVSIVANTTYVVSVNVDRYYVATNSGLATSIVNGPLSSVADGANAVFGSSGAFPQTSWQNSNYFRDVVFVPGTNPPPQNYTVTPSGSNVTFSPSGAQTIASGAKASFTVAANSGFVLSQSVGGTCPAGTWAGNVYTTGVISANCALSFSASASTGTSYSLFPTLQPVIKNVADGVPYELGMKFRSSQAGTITAIRYYKPTGEAAGGHTGRIWSASGTVLTSVTFTSETASGWQTATLSTPLAISANTTYVVSVNIKTNYAATNNGLQTAITNGPLSTVADGLNGLYGNPNVFPTSSWQASNYFRDVVFVP